MTNNFFRGDPVVSLVEKYYRHILFLFLPNLCNADCYFCYVKPALSTSARIQSETLSTLSAFLEMAHKVGFRQIRLTGGEPLVFENLREVTSIVAGLGMEYTLLTNGIDLEKHLPHILTQKPLKITLSVHSILNQNKIFGVATEPEKLLRNILRLTESNIHVTATLLLLPENEDEIISVIDILAIRGVQSFKIVYPNFKKTPVTQLQKFKNTIITLEAARYKNLDIRYTDLGQKQCLLVDRGFLSLTLPNFRLHPCCTLVNSSGGYRLHSQNFSSFPDILFKIHDNFTAVKKYPCESHIPACPISLASMEFPR